VAGKDQLDEKEAQRRFEKLVRTALNTPPKPMKDLPRKKPKAAVKQTRTTRRET
jgi:hypothetical protein